MLMPCSRGVRTTAQFSTKIIYPTPGEPHLWSTDNVSHFSFSQDKQGFKADGCSMELSEDGNSYKIKSNVNKNSIVDVTFTRVTPGFVAGQNGTSYFGTDPKKPWGRMLHAFWPRCKVEGTIITKKGPVNFNGGGALSHALQGMKPHFAASKWNFCDFQSPSFSAILMDFVTPPSYGQTVVATGVIATDAGILIGGASPQVKAQHTQVRGDPDNDWPEPGAVLFTWEGQTKDGKSVKAELSGALPPRIDRVDVMGELPKFVKQIVAGASGTKPYIYQYTPKMTIKITTDGEVKEEEGNLFMEATFIS
nr:survival factor 1 [Quercus suber]